MGGAGAGPEPSPVEQVQALRGLRAVCARGSGDLLQLTGADRLDLLQRLSASDLKGARPGAVVATVFTNDKGRLVDVAMTAVAENALWLAAGNGSGARLAEWLARYIIMEDVQVERRSAQAGDTWISAAPSLPAPGTWMRSGTTLWVREPDPWPQLTHSFAGALELKQAVGGADYPVLHDHCRVAEIAYAQWCIEVGRLRPGPDLDEALNPLEAGLTPWVSLTKGCFIGQEVVARLANYDKVRRRPVRLDCPTPAPPAAGTPLTAEGRPAGWVVAAVQRCDRPGTTALAVVVRELPVGARLQLPSGVPVTVEAVFAD